jgi:hypothetical protein
MAVSISTSRRGQMSDDEMSAGLKGKKVPPASIGALSNWKQLKRWLIAQRMLLQFEFEFHMFVFWAFCATAPPQEAKCVWESAFYIYFTHGVYAPLLPLFPLS